MLELAKKLTVGDWDIADNELGRLTTYLCGLPEGAPLNLFRRVLDVSAQRLEWELFVTVTSATFTHLAREGRTQDMIELMDTAPPAIGALDFATPELAQPGVLARVIRTAGLMAAIMEGLPEGQLETAETVATHLAKLPPEERPSVHLDGAEEALRKVVQAGHLEAAEWLMGIIGAAEGMEKFSERFSLDKPVPLALLAEAAGGRMAERFDLLMEQIGQDRWSTLSDGQWENFLACMERIAPEERIAGFHAFRLENIDPMRADYGQYMADELAQCLGRDFKQGVDNLVLAVKNAHGEEEALQLVKGEGKYRPSSGVEANDGNYTPLSFALDLMASESAAALLDYAEQLGDGQTALAMMCQDDAVHRALLSDDTGMTDMLLDRRADLEGKSWQQVLMETPFDPADPHRPNGTLLWLLEEVENAKDAAALVEKLPDIWVDKLASQPKHLLWQELGSGQMRWQSVFNEEAPHPTLDGASPFGFSQKVYDAVLPLMETVMRMENAGQPAEGMPEAAAYKLAVLFSSGQEAERFLSNAYGKWREDGDFFPISRALDFTLPENGRWDIGRWKNLVLQHGPEVTPYLFLAPEIEKALEEKGRRFPRQPEELQNIAYLRREENPELADFALAHNIKTKTFDRALELLQGGVEKGDHLPEVHIDGDALGLPGFYMEKLPKGDVRGPFLGVLMNEECCQYLGGVADFCAAHGASSEYGGFYVWKEKSGASPSPEDRLVAMSWAWIGKGGELVLDSFERVDAEKNALAEPFMRAFADAVRETHPEVRMGIGSDTPRNMTFALADTLAEPVDSRRYRDSAQQYSITGWNVEKALRQSWQGRVSDRSEIADRAR